MKGNKGQKQRAMAYCPTILLYNRMLADERMHRECGISAAAWLPPIWPQNPEPLFAFASLLNPYGINDNTPRPA